MDKSAGRSANGAEWADLTARRPRSEIYAVITTGIACRFGCPSRLPLRQNLRLFDSLPAAQAAGYRPCLRCQPQGCVHSTHPTLGAFICS